MGVEDPPEPDAVVASDLPSDFPLGLSQIMDTAVASFDPSQHVGQTEDVVCIKRIQAAMPSIHQFLTAMRMGEGVLSKTAILGGEQDLNVHNFLVAEAAKSRALFGPDASRQSRATMRMGFQKGLASKAAKL